MVATLVLAVATTCNRDEGEQAADARTETVAYCGGSRVWVDMTEEALYRQCRHLDGDGNPLLNVVESRPRSGLKILQYGAWQAWDELEGQALTIVLYKAPGAGRRVVAELRYEAARPPVYLAPKGGR